MSILPEYPNFREIRLEDAAIFNEYFHKHPPLISEYTFTNLFMWRNYYHFTWTLWNQLLCIMAHHPEHIPFFLPPIGDTFTRDCIINCIKYLRSKGFPGEVQRIPEALVDKNFKDAQEFDVMLDRNNSDYVYLKDDLIRLPGNRYHRKKNQINQFKKKYTFQYQPLTLELVQQCLTLESHWCDLKHCDQVPSLSGEEQAIHDALSNMHILNFKGGAIFIDGKIEAFSLGERLNENTAVIHIEKANPAFEGLNQTLSQMFTEQACSSFVYINREQDLGEGGLRQAKLSYHPHHFINKYIVRLKGA
jgi:hypothetical protein